MRQKACEAVKSKVEERAQARDQPVVLTRQGATWIRRVCGTGGHGEIASRDAEFDAGDAARVSVEDTNHDESERCERGECT